MTTASDMDIESFRLSITNRNRKRRGRGSPWSKKALKATSDTNNKDSDHGYNNNNNNFGHEAAASTCTRTRQDNQSLSDRLCNLHVVDWKELLFPHHNRHRIHKRRRTGEQLARKKAFGAMKGDDHNGQLVYRKREDFCNQAYTDCTFLDSYDKVLALDCDGLIDILRLDDLRHGQKATKSTPIVSDLELGSLLPIRDASSIFMEPLGGGSTIAVGSRDDDMFLLDLEQCSSTVSKHLQCLTPLTTGANGTRKNLKAWHTTCPQRYYYRDRHNPNLTLAKLADNRIESRHHRTIEDLSELERIEYNGHSQFPNSVSGRFRNQIRFVPHLQPSTKARWDVREFYKGCSHLIQLAHVDSDYDAFWTRLMDQRSKNNQPVVIVDSTSQNYPGTKEEHITSVASFSDVCLATAHVSCPKFGLTSPRDFFDRDLTYSGQGMATCVKIWDIRMLPLSTGASSRAPRPANVITIPSFPQENTMALSPIDCIQTYLTPKGSLAFSDPAVGVQAVDIPSTRTTISGGDYVITNLEGSGGDDCGRCNNGSSNMGSLVITTQSRSRSSTVGHHKLDLGTRQVTRIVSQTNESLGCHPVYDISPSHDIIVCYTHEGGGGSPSSGKLEIHDLGDDKGHTTSTRSAHRKESFVDRPCAYQLEPALHDRYGTQTSLSCVAINDNGTSILGGSTDGDLFVWRGF